MSNEKSAKKKHTHTQKKTTTTYIIVTLDESCWLIFNMDPCFLAYEIIPPNKWVVQSAMYNK